MNVLVLTAAVPFAVDPIERVERQIIEHLRRFGTNAEAFRIPVGFGTWEHLIEQTVVGRSLQLANIDRLISLRFPAYLVPHPDKVCWLHDHPLLPQDSCLASARIPNTARGQEVTRLVRNSDLEAFGKVRRLYAGSTSVYDHLRSYGLDTEMMTVPPDDRPDDWWDGTVKKLLS